MAWNRPALRKSHCPSFPKPQITAEPTTATMAMVTVIVISSASSFGIRLSSRAWTGQTRAITKIEKNIGTKTDCAK